MDPAGCKDAFVNCCGTIHHGVQIHKGTFPSLNDDDNMEQRAIMDVPDQFDSYRRGIKHHRESLADALLKVGLTLIGETKSYYDGKHVISIEVDIASKRKTKKTKRAHSFAVIS